MLGVLLITRLIWKMFSHHLCLPSLCQYGQLHPEHCGSTLLILWRPTLLPMGGLFVRSWFFICSAGCGRLNHFVWWHEWRHPSFLPSLFHDRTPPTRINTLPISDSSLSGHIPKGPQIRYHTYKWHLGFGWCPRGLCSMVSNSNKPWWPLCHHSWNQPYWMYWRTPLYHHLSSRTPSQLHNFQHS